MGGRSLLVMMDDLLIFRAGEANVSVKELTGIDVPTGLLIGGEWTGGRGGGTLPVIDPSTEDAVAEVADGTVEDALDAVTAAPARGNPAPDLRADDRERGRAGQADDHRERQGAARRQGRGDLLGRVLPLVRRRGGPDGGRADA